VQRVLTGNGVDLLGQSDQTSVRSGCSRTQHASAGPLAKEGAILPPKRPPPADPPRSGLTAWLDQKTHPESRASRYLSFTHSALQLLGLAGILGLLIQLHEANVATRRAVYSQSVDAALLLHQLEFAHPDLICALDPDGPERRLEQGQQEVVRYLEMNLHLHERLWQQHRDGIFDEEEWVPWEQRFRDEVVTAEMFPAVWHAEGDYYQEDFIRYVDAVVADELSNRAATTAAAGGSPSLQRTLADYAAINPAATPAC
jgi:hypothetical protein